VPVEHIKKKRSFIRRKQPCNQGAGNSLARPTSRCALFDGENISFDASLVLYIYIYSMVTEILNIEK